MTDTTTEATAPTAPRKLREIATEIQQSWGEKVYFGARPYLEAMADLEDIGEKYGHDTGSDVVQRFLLNATTWRGADARRIKAELKAMLPARR
jgi:hypothetical protein